MKVFRTVLVSIALMTGLAGCGTSAVDGAANPGATNSTNAASETADLNVAPTAVDAPSSVPAAPPVTSVQDETATSRTSGPDLPPSTSQATSGAPIDGAKLVAGMVEAFDETSSQRVTVTDSVGGVESTVETVMQMNNGQIMALDMVSTTGEGDDRVETHLVMVHGGFYMSGPLVEQYSDGKEYLEVSAESGRPEIQELYGLFEQALHQSTVGDYTAFLGATRTIVDRGETTVEGVEARHYDAVVDVPLFLELYPEAANSGQVEILHDAGVDEIPMSLWFDETGRLVRAEHGVTLAGKTTGRTLSSTSFNEPVQILQPGPNDVEHG